MRYLTGLIIVLAISTVMVWYTFTVPDSPQLVSIDLDAKQQSAENINKSNSPSHHSQTSSAADPQISKYCYKDKAIAQPIDDDGHLGVLVWNIYKQNEDNWQKALTQYAQKSQLMMLQEASLSDEFKAWIEKQSWGASYVSAFKVFDVGAGVLNLANQMPKTACAYTAVEPWILLPKSGLYASYALSNGQTLAAINVHAINFTIGTEEYTEQIQALEEALAKHKGPVIMGGDFNTWSEDRMMELTSLVDELGLQEVNFTPDNRRLFVNGLPLDHLFYRGLKLIKAHSPVTDASDHNPLLAEFDLIDK